jgi:hypothetical protein
MARLYLQLVFFPRSLANKIDISTFFIVRTALLYSWKGTNKKLQTTAVIFCVVSMVLFGAIVNMVLFCAVVNMVFFCVTFSMVLFCTIASIVLSCITFSMVLSCTIVGMVLSFVTASTVLFCVIAGTVLLVSECSAMIDGPKAWCVLSNLHFAPL